MAWGDAVLQEAMVVSSDLVVVRFHAAPIFVDFHSSAALAGVLLGGRTPFLLVN